MGRLIATCQDETGAVTTDWVVLAAIAVAFAIAIIPPLSGQLDAISADTGAALSNADVAEIDLTE